MLKLVVGTIALMIATLPAAAQSTSSGGAGQMSAPTTPNSGAGVPGQAGNKSGPAAKSPPGTTGAAPQSGTSSGTSPDTSKIPGQPGNKSGPATRSPSGSNSR